MNREAVANELVRIAEDLVAMDFPTQDAYDTYMKEHPDADKSLHHVKETKKEAPAKKIPPVSSGVKDKRSEDEIELEESGNDDAGLPRRMTRRDLPSKGNSGMYYDNGEITVNSLYDNFTKAYDPNREESEMLIKKLKPKMMALLKKHGIKHTEPTIDISDDGAGNAVNLRFKVDKIDTNSDKYTDFTNEVEKTLGTVSVD